MPEHRKAIGWPVRRSTDAPTVRRADVLFGDDVHAGAAIVRLARLGAVAEDTEQVETERTDPEREARRRLALAQIRQYPDPVLRMRAAEVDRFDANLENLVERMTRLMQDAAGVGLAANQVGVLQRVVVMQAAEDEEPRALVNPVIVERSEGTEPDSEGCLSMQGVLVPVERSLQIAIEARDAAGEPVRIELDDLAARVAQHELDHIDGILIIDRTTPDGRREALGVLRQSTAV
jgi:peptide deformylase